MENPWVFHVFPMVDTWDFLWGFKYGHRKDMGHEKPLDFHGQYDGFSKYDHAVTWKTCGSDMGFHGIQVTMDFQ